MKKLIQLKLKILAKIILAKYKPDVIGITGSVGKTSAKEAIFTVLASKFSARKNIKNYNNEIGAPLTIIGSESPGKSIFGWFFVFLKALKLILIRDKNYPKILVLEMGVDRPMDMDYLNTIAKSKIGVITAIGPVHLEFFNEIENIQKEKGKLIKALPKSGWAILNYDDEKVMQIARLSKAKILTYGFNSGADIRARELVFNFSNLNEPKKGTTGQLAGISFKVSHNNSSANILLPNVIGRAAVYAALSAAAVGLAFGLNLTEIAKALSGFKSPKGRMNLIPGIKNTLIIDDTYNSSPQSLASALSMLSKAPLVSGARKFAVLGDMLELGSVSEEEHRKAGRLVFESGIDKLIVVGERSRDIAGGAEKAGTLPDNIFHFAAAGDAGKFIQNRINEGDLILVKGSQGMRLEKIVKEIMSEPLRAKELLVRQGEEWIAARNA
ncbi:UDP-N-acetylmuramoyl-tripeptide--D-alanyl-D-alanine ligase [Candidatus Parcubacteria bacterium]|nr:UDP-N-acetylmuramoyl-tripeptide--D-alanyl-D-alanine ligase [Candidatus Parcubacteria bacterium]